MQYDRLCLKRGLLNVGLLDWQRVEDWWRCSNPFRFTKGGWF
jgi:hypothetical protein